EVVTALAFTPHGDRLAIGGYDGSVRRYDWRPREPQVIQQAGASVFALSCSPDGRLLAAGDSAGKISLWEIGEGEEARPPPLAGQHDWTVYGLVFTPDGRMLVSGSADGTVRLWQVDSGRETRRFRWHTRWVTCVAVSPDGMTAAAGSADHTIVVWD